MKLLPDGSRARRETAFGLFVGLGAVLLVVTIWRELSGELPVVWALLLLADTLIVWRLSRLRARTDEPSEPDAAHH